MDPDAAYYEMYCAMRDGDFPKARAMANNLKNWLDRGGFYPQKYSRVEVISYLSSVLRRTVCNVSECQMVV